MVSCTYILALHVLLIYRAMSSVSISKVVSHVANYMK